MYPNFFNLLHEYDIIILIETFVTTEKIPNYVKYFSQYKLLWIPATKINLKGRPSGGMLIAVKLNVNEFCFEKLGELNTIHIKS